MDNYINNSKNSQVFPFSFIFDQKTKQDEVFQTVCKEVIDKAVDGFNGTVFAYGQTGSGKTFTMTGGAEKYSDRGMIPRSISYLFETINKANNQNFTVFASYLEIYNNVGYDLLSTDSTKNQDRRLEDLERVVPFENDGELILKGLEKHKAENEEDL